MSLAIHPGLDAGAFAGTGALVAAVAMGAIFSRFRKTRHTTHAAPSTCEAEAFPYTTAVDMQLRAALAAAKHRRSVSGDTGLAPPSGYTALPQRYTYDGSAASVGGGRRPLERSWIRAPGEGGGYEARRVHTGAAPAPRGGVGGGARVVHARSFDAGSASMPMYSGSWSTRLEVVQESQLLGKGGMPMMEDSAERTRREAARALLPGPAPRRGASIDCSSATAQRSTARAAPRRSLDAQLLREPLDWARSALLGRRRAGARHKFVPGKTAGDTAGAEPGEGRPPEIPQAPSRVLTEQGATSFIRNLMMESCSSSDDMVRAAPTSEVRRRLARPPTHLCHQLKPPHVTPRLTCSAWSLPMRPGRHQIMHTMVVVLLTAFGTARRANHRLPHPPSSPTPVYMHGPHTCEVAMVQASTHSSPPPSQEGLREPRSVPPARSPLEWNRCRVQPQTCPALPIYGRPVPPSCSPAVKPSHGLIMETMHIQSDLDDGQLQLFRPLQRVNASISSGGGQRGGGRGEARGGGAAWNVQDPAAYDRSRSRDSSDWALRRQSCDGGWRRGSTDWGRNRRPQCTDPRRQSISDTFRGVTMDPACPASRDASRSQETSRQVFHGTCCALSSSRHLLHLCRTCMHCMHCKFAYNCYSTQPVGCSRAPVQACTIRVVQTPGHYTWMPHPNASGYYQLFVCMYVGMYDYIAVSTRTLTPPDNRDRD